MEKISEPLSFLDRLCERDRGILAILYITSYMGRASKLGNTVPGGMVTEADMGCKSYSAWVVWSERDKTDALTLVSHCRRIKETPFACPLIPKRPPKRGR